MEWVKDFYTKQREWLGSAGYWATLSVSDLPEKAGRQAALVDRLAPGDGKRVLELGCGGGMDAAAIALAGEDGTVEREGECDVSIRFRCRWQPFIGKPLARRRR